MLTHLQQVIQICWQPLTVFRQVRDRAPVGVALLVGWLSATVYVTVSGALLQYVQWGGRRLWLTGRTSPLTMIGYGQLWARGILQAGMSAGMMVLFIAVVFVPFVILLASLFERRTRLSLLLRQEYASILSCALVAMTFSLWVALPPALILSWQSTRLSSQAVMAYFVVLVALPLPILAGLMTLAIGVVFHLRWPAAFVVSLLSFLSLVGMPLLMQAATMLCASPFLLLFLLFLLRDRVDDFMRHSRSRQAFQRNMELATMNPADASAHYNLGLLYQQRGELAEAAKSFRRAVEIDPNETDAHYQLGRIAREENRLAEGIQHFEQVIARDSAHSHHEVWREIAQVYYAAGQYPDAMEMLDRFLRERPSDAEGHYWRAMTLDRLNRPAEAAAEMRECIQAVKTSPAYKYRAEKKWLSLAENYLRDL